MAGAAQRQMALVAFMQAGNTSVYTGSWRHPATEHGFLTAGYYQRLGRTLEEGCFDLMFFDDRLAMPGIYGGSVAEAVRTGARPVKLDLSIVLGVVAGATEHIGLGATYSTTYYAPFHVARTFATLDHLSGGRAAWNIVTSVNDSEAQNFGVDDALGHDARYDRADEFLEATVGPVGHLGRRRPRARPRGGASSPDPTRCTSSTTRASGSRSAGPLTVPRSPQGRPVLLQAGSSGRGRDFAARWAEVIFTGDPNIDIARSHYQDQKERLAEGGRDPDSVKMLPMAYAVVGETRAQAEDREQLLLNDLVDPMASLTLLSELMNYDFSGHGARRSDHRRADRVGERHPWPRAEHQEAHRRRHRHPRRPGRPPRHPAPGPSLRRHRPRGRRPDGGVVRAPGPATASSWRPPTAPAPTRTSCGRWCPELQRRGVFRDRYTGDTLRGEHGPRPPRLRR